MTNTRCTASGRWVTAYLGLGSNMGDAAGNCRKGLSLLDATDGVSVTAVSPFYNSAPVDYTDQDWFVNGAAEIETSLSPLALLDCVKLIEWAVGRRPGIRFGPRILDMDILLYDHRVIVASGLAVPHPRMAKRMFVLKPLCDINPDIVHPVLGVTMGSLLRSCNDPEQRIKPVD
ncbi:MAG: 2-amino-4-hydroxy-6-hydroxymethyldihydropteridine diphosphokinase [Deltaproteobacteria bacterium]|nr:MAG: 2-amino-4-hydroxy-6-hydroxymethyldihydropteridine diphosphokinase [Deltaproteobacteria bacterium]